MKICLIKYVFITLILFSQLVVAQGNYPNKPISMINPNPPGGFVDNVARNLSIVLQKKLNQPVIVINKPGANGSIGHAFVANAAPDGYTLLITSPSLVTQPAIDQMYNKNSSYTLNKLIPIAQITSDPAIILVNPQTNIKSIKELIQVAKSSNGQIAISSSGTYGATHLPMAMIEQNTGIKFRHVPTSGGAPAMNLALGGHVQAVASAPSVAYAQTQAGKLIPLAQSGAIRLPPFMEVPTLNESNIPVTYSLWTSIFAPAGTPENVVKELTKALKMSIQDEQFKTSLANGYSTLEYMDGEAFNSFWINEVKKLQDTVKQIGKVED